MDTKKLIPIISMVSVLVMFLWGYLANDWSKSWPPAQSQFSSCFSHHSGLTVLS